MFSQGNLPRSSGSTFDMRRLMNKRPAHESGNVRSPFGQPGHGLMAVLTCWRCGAEFRKPLVRDPAWCPHCGAIGG